MEGLKVQTKINVINDSDSITIRVATVNDTDAVLEFSRKFYYPEEPITLGNEPKQQSEEDEAFHTSLIPIGTSIVATNGNNDIVGVLLAGPVEPTEADSMLQEAKYCKDRKWAEILYLLAHLDEQANIYQRYHIDRALHVHAIAVHSKTRGQSVGRKMMEMCMEMGKELGFPLLVADCSSFYSIRMAEKLRMDCVGALAYEDYKDEQGRPVFRPPLPHTHIKTFAKIL